MKRILSLLLSLIFVVTFSACSIISKSNSTAVECPNFVGITFEEITHDDELVGMFDFQYEWNYNDEYEYGVIFEQSIKKGEHIKQGTHIVLNVSMGIKKDE